MFKVRKAAIVTAITVAGSAAALLGPAPSAHADEFLDGAYGVPDYCTYNIDISFGWAGSHSVSYKSSYWSYNPAMGKPMKLHSTYEYWRAYSNGEHPGEGPAEHWCND